MNKKNIIKYAGATLLVLAVVISDETFDHTKEACVLSKYLGVEHQIQEIEKQPGWTAWKVYDYDHPMNPDNDPTNVDVDNPKYDIVLDGTNLETSDGMKYNNLDSVVVARKYTKEDANLPYSDLVNEEPVEENVIKINKY